jgi:hypothetical protein
MKSKWIILFFLGSLPFGQDVIGEGLYEEALINFLRANYKTSTTLGYTDARDVMYLEIDREDDGLVYGIYTNYAVFLPESGVDPSTHLYENGMNCEHIWPQSMYEGSDPMKSDMHHLRPSKENVNSSRGNKPFGENPDSQTDTWFWMSQSQSYIPSNNIDEYSESETAYFEPREDRKGDIARSVFYFYTMYSEVTEDNFFEVQKGVLQTWHEQDPINEDELNRTWAIASYQQNKPNPFILDATLVERAYFYNGALQGDLNSDETLNVLDIVALVNIILSQEGNNPLGDMNGDGELNVLDVVILANIILSQN